MFLFSQIAKKSNFHFLHCSLSKSGLHECTLVPFQGRPWATKDSQKDSYFAFVHPRKAEIFNVEPYSPTKSNNQNISIFCVEAFPREGGLADQEQIFVGLAFTLNMIPTPNIFAIIYELT